MATPLFALPPKDPRILQTRLKYLVRVMCQTRLAFSLHLTNTVYFFMREFIPLCQIATQCVTI